MSVRSDIRDERLSRLSTMERKTVRVLPRDDDMRRVLKHPNGMAFRPEGSIEWPLDQYTKRRLADGSITLEDDTAAQQRLEERAPGEQVMAPEPRASRKKSSEQSETTT